MAKRRKGLGVLKRTDHLLDMSPAGRNLFVSRDKQMQNQSARRIKAWMRVVIALVILAVAAALGMLAAFYLVPWFRAEMAAGPAGSSSLTSSGETSLPPVEEYDSLGLPVYGDEMCLFVVNESNPASADFAPELAEVEDVRVDARISAAVKSLCAAAEEEGLALVFAEGYVSYQEQEKRFEAEVERRVKEEGLTAVMAKTEAKEAVPQPGESDFQSGLCLRLTGDPATFSASRTFSWLKNNMGKYGFIFRYPEYKEEYTGHTAETTVIRYVGAKHAEAMQQRSMCLEEYLSNLARQ